MKGDWDKDPTFQNLAKKEGLKLHRLSYQCFNLDCVNCDGKIHYKIKKEITGFRGKMVDGVMQSEWHGQYRSARTGKMEGKREFEEIIWDTEMESVQIEGGASQNPMNTPEGSKCECHHCHGRKGYDKWKARGGTPKPGYEPTRGFAKDEYEPGQEPPK
jgi:hypothetical protein